MEPIGSLVPGATTRFALRSFTGNRRALVGTLERLASGGRINLAADDPPGLVRSENLRAALASLEAETETLQRADQLLSAADGALEEISGMLAEARGLAVANSSSGFSDAERAANQVQIDALVDSANHIAATASFSGQSLLDGTATVTADGQTFAIDAVQIDAVDSVADPEAAVAALTAAAETVSTLRGGLGSFTSNTVQARINTVDVTIENVTSADSVIRDTDFARESASLARLSVLDAASLGALRLAASPAPDVFRLLG